MSDATIFAFQRNIVVAASAGTGKTHRLTALYLLLTLGLTSLGQADPATPSPPITPDRIIATTFSRAAALEIARRVEQALRGVAGWDGGAGIPFAEVIRARERALGITLSPGELRARAAGALARWAWAKIDTLHGVAAQIARGHALALGLPPGARVLDEDEAQAIGEVAVDEALGAALTAGGERARAARALIATCGGVAGARQAVIRLLDRLDEEGIEPPDLALADHAGPARELSRELIRVTRGAASAGGDAFRKPAAALAVELGTYAAQLDAGAQLPEEAFARIVDLFQVRKPAAKQRTRADDDLVALRDRLPGESNAVRAYRLIALLCEAPSLAQRERDLVRLIEHARSLQRAARRRAGALGFGDLLRAARDGMRDEREVSRTVRSSLDVLLVDEFQDTSRVQRDLVYLLRERDDAAAARPKGAAPAAEGLSPHGLFLVGDRKQSIYGFRGADVAVFSRICAELAGAAAGEALLLPRAMWSPSRRAAVEAPLDEPISDRGAAPPISDRGAAPSSLAPKLPLADFVALRESRRSGAAVLDFVNAFAARDFEGSRGDGAAARDFEVAYGSAEHLFSATEGASPGEVVLVTDDGGIPDAAPPIVREAVGPAREGFVAAAFVAREVRRSVESGMVLQWRDVAILARRRSTLPLIELALGRLDVPYVVAGRALYDAREIRDVAALLRLLLDPGDRLALATVLRGPVVALSERSLALLSAPGRGLSLRLLGPTDAIDDDPVSAAVESRVPTLDPPDRARLAWFRGRFGDLRRAALRVAPAEAIRAALTGFELDRVLAALPRPEARIGNVDRLITLARRRGGSLAAFVRWLDRRILDEADEPEAAVFSPDDDAVRLTTVHASKGLDFPVVVLVDLNAEPRPMNVGVGLMPSSEDRPATLVVRHIGRHPARGAGDDDPFGAAQPIPLSTALLREARADATAREQAERCRLTYVGMTRARRMLVLIGSPAPPRRGSAWSTLRADGTIAAIGAAITRVEHAAALLEVTPGPLAEPRPRDAGVVPSMWRPRASTTRSLAIATTVLGMFRGCARRYRFHYLLGLEEPVASGQLDLFALAALVDEPARDDERSGDADPRDLGRAAHRVLQRWPADRWGAPTSPVDVATALLAEGFPPGSAETARMAAGIAALLEGPYAAALGRTGAALLREEEFVLEVIPAAVDAPRGEPGAAPGRRGSSRAARGASEGLSSPAPALALRGAMDLLVAHPDGLVDVIDYKRSAARADLSPYEFQLRAYALAARERYPGQPVRAGVLYLGGPTEPSFLRGAGEGGALSEDEHGAFERELSALAGRYAQARYEDRWEGVPLPQCKDLHCGFVHVCHARAARTAG